MEKLNSYCSDEAQIAQIKANDIQIAQIRSTDAQIVQNRSNCCNFGSNNAEIAPIRLYLGQSLEISLDWSSNDTQFVQMKLNLI